MNLQGSEGLGLLVYLWSTIIEFTHISWGQLAVRQSMIASTGTTGMTWLCITGLLTSSRLVLACSLTAVRGAGTKPLHVAYLLTLHWSKKNHMVNFKIKGHRNILI